MSIIHHPQHAYPMAQTPPTPPSPRADNNQPLTPETINTVLRAGPSWSGERTKAASPRAPAPPNSANLPGADQTVGKLQALLSSENIDAMLHDPASAETKAALREMGELVEKSAPTQQRGAGSQANAKALESIGTQLKEETIKTKLQQAFNQPTEAENKEFEKTVRRLQLALMQAIVTENWDGSDDVLEKMNAYVKSLETKQNESKKVADQLIGWGKKLSNNGSPPASAASSSQDPNRNNFSYPARTFSFASTTESGAAAPREVMDFVQGRDKLDVSGIRNQLGTPLKLVEHFSGARGEMQIHYLPSTHTSVVAIAGNPGEPPFVVKVFGQVTRRDLVT